MMRFFLWPDRSLPSLLKLCSISLGEKNETDESWVDGVESIKSPLHIADDLGRIGEGKIDRLNFTDKLGRAYG